MGLYLAACSGVSAWQIERDDDRIAFVGELHISDAPAIWRRLREVAAPPAEALTFDLAGATTIDGAAMSLIVERRAQLITQGIRCEIVGGSTELRELVRLLHGDRAVPRRLTRARPGALATLGAGTEQVLKRAYSLVGFAGELVASIRRPRSTNVRSLPALIARAGADGVPIVLVLNFLVGFVMAFQSTQQLKLYGANVYVADIVGISITRELAPLMTAIIMAGRSGAAYAAELGTMRISCCRASSRSRSPRRCSRCSETSSGSAAASTSVRAASASRPLAFSPSCGPCSCRPTCGPAWSRASRSASRSRSSGASRD